MILATIAKFATARLSALGSIPILGKAFLCHWENTLLEVLVIVLQETHCTTTKKLVIANFERAGPSLSKKHGLATLVNEQIKWTLRSQSPPSSNTEWLCMDVDLPVFPHHSVYTDNFKSPHTDWGYNTNSADRDFLVTWANFNNLPSFIIQRKQPVSIPVAAILA